MSRYWVPLICPHCGYEDQADSEDLDAGLVLICEECGEEMGDHWETCG